MGLEQAMEVYIVQKDSHYWFSARKLRHEVFFRDFGLSEEVMDDAGESSAVHIVATQSGELIACVRLNQSSEARYQLSQMAVALKHQKKGIGKKLLEYLEILAVERGAQEIFLNARLSAIDFYVKQGYQVKGDEFPSAITGMHHIVMFKAMGTFNPNNT